MSAISLASTRRSPNSERPRDLTVVACRQRRASQFLGANMAANLQRAAP
eukprot:CAMPEP_0117508030 /NCGR_PEP_ID=MMETSP0784-20121206/26732_1 /TAXON_ID=39447 /ORGANISM="" /LENGTH=48 /DNA_ID= /DNA_START= /DNA_END= /DNA_ORIENTATION=